MRSVLGSGDGDGRWESAERKDVQPNMSFKLTSAVRVNSSSRISVSTIVPLRWLIPPMTAPTDSTYVRTRRTQVCGGRRLTLELQRRDDIDLHDGLEDDRVTLGERLLERTLCSESESELRGIDLMSGSILEDELASRDRVSRQDSTLERVVESLHAHHRQCSTRTSS
jgi:hypothetical protein